MPTRYRAGMRPRSRGNQGVRGLLERLVTAVVSSPKREVRMSWPEENGTLSIRDRADAVTGYREWILVSTADGPRLGSIWSDTLWHPGQPLEAACRKPHGWINAWAWQTAQNQFPHTFAPDPRCRCGLSARTRRRSRSAAEVPARISGLVRGWGLVIAAPSAWRAQYAEPVALERASIPEEMRDRLGTDYGINFL